MWRNSIRCKAVLVCVLGTLLVTLGLSSGGTAVAKPHTSLTFTKKSNRITNRYLPDAVRQRQAHGLPSRAG